MLMLPHEGLLDVSFRQITTFIKFHSVLVLGLQTLWLIDFSRIYQLKGLKTKNKGRMKFYECCDLTKKGYLVYTYLVKTMRILKCWNYYLLAWIWYNRCNPVSNHSKNSLFQFLKSLSFLKVIQKQIWKSIAFAVYF